MKYLCGYFAKGFSINYIAIKFNNRNAEYQRSIGYRA